MLANLTPDTRHVSRITQHAPTMPHYILDARTATPHFPGISRYVTNLARAMVPLLAPDERLTVLYDPAHPIALRIIRRGANRAAGHLAVFAGAAMDRPATAAGVTGCSSIQHPASNIHRLPQSLHADALPAGVPTVLTVYDLIPLRYPEHSTARARLLSAGRRGWPSRCAARDRDLRFHPS